MFHTLLKMSADYCSFISLAQKTQDNINHLHLDIGCNFLSGFPAVTALFHWYFSLLLIVALQNI